MSARVSMSELHQIDDNWVEESILQPDTFLSELTKTLGIAEDDSMEPESRRFQSKPACTFRDDIPFD